MLPQTFGPFNSRITRFLAKRILSKSDKILVRGKDSMELMQNFLGEDKAPVLCPDVAFILESVLPDKPDIQPELKQNSSVPLIGLNINGLLYIGGYKRNNTFGLMVHYKEFINVLLKSLLTRTDAHILLVPHVFGGVSDEDERLIGQQLLESIDEQYAHRIHLIAREYNQSELKGIISSCDFFIGSRMHACIAAISQCIPTIGLAYSKKFKEVFECVGLEQSVIDMRRNGAEEILSAISEAYDKRADITEYLENVIPSAQEKLFKIFRDLL